MKNAKFSYCINACTDTKEGQGDYAKQYKREEGIRGNRQIDKRRISGTERMIIDHFECDGNRGHFTGNDNGKYKIIKQACQRNKHEAENDERQYRLSTQRTDHVTKHTLFRKLIDNQTLRRKNERQVKTINRPLWICFFIPENII